MSIAPPTMSIAPLAALTRATISGVLVTPIGALLVFGSLAAWPAVVATAPLGIASRNGQDHGLPYEIAFMSAVAGISLATAQRKRLDLWIRASRKQLGIGLDAGAVAACGLVCATLTILPALFLGGSDGLRAAQILPRIVGSAAASPLAVRLSARPETAAWTVALLSYLLPVLLPGPEALARAAAAAVALLLAAWLLDHPPRASRSRGSR